MSKRKIFSSVITFITILGFLLYNQFNEFNTRLNKNNTTSIIQTQIDNYNSTIDTEWSYNKYPDYYTTIGPAQIDETKFPETGDITYTGKDSLGRTGPVYGTINLDMIIQSSAEERPDFKRNDNPSGWTQNIEVSIETTTGTYKGWFFNRSHLIADQLGGEATSNNAITGTRMQNVGNSSQTGGMRYIEQKTVDYLHTHQSAHVYYSATPVYTENELIPRFIIVDAKSNDDTLNERVLVYNYQNGYTINYYDGTLMSK